MAGKPTLNRRLPKPSPSPTSEFEGQAESRLSTDDLENATFAEEPLKPEKIFPFLKLPAELRDMIYEHVAKDNKATLTDELNLKDCSGLLDTCRQIRQELSSVLTLHAGTIITNVTDFDFAHVEAFLNNLSDVELSSLVLSSQAHTRVFEIRIHIKRAPQDTKPLYRWLHRVGDSTQEGIMPEITYVEGLVPARRHMSKLRHAILDWIIDLLSSPALGESNKRAIEEVSKIWTTLRGMRKK